MVNDNDPNAGDWPTPELLGRLFDRYAAPLELFARQWCDCAEDVVQESLIELAGQPRLPDDPAAWLYRVVRNRAITAWRSSQRRRRHETAAVGDRSAFERSAGDRLDADVAAAALESLSIKLREVVVARIWGGLTFQQIGKLVGVSDSAAHRRYEAALSALREKLRTLCPKND
ncbi:MAG: sigma-70 family RNA polymerase sigma factor [Thermoguttaceae bacterium]|jgi:RNA polymerase sigma-70 factor (ECF subfamily)